MRRITFRDGNTISWPTYRGMMLGEISPQAAVARMRRSPEPAGALDEALPRRRARDQNGGKLDGSYCRATDQFLRSSGLPDEDVEAVMQILGKSAEEEPAAEDSGRDGDAAGSEDRCRRTARPGRRQRSALCARPVRPVWPTAPL